MSNLGFVHLTFSQLQEIRLIHLVSGMDEDAAPDMPDAAIGTAITGYTEWVTQGERPVTLGWDWQMLRKADVVKLSRISVPNSNLVLELASGAEIPHAKADMLLAAYVDSFDWQTETLQHLHQRYHSQPR